MDRPSVIALSLGSSIGLALVDLCVGTGVERLAAGLPLGTATIVSALLAALAAGVCAWGASNLTGSALVGRETTLRHGVLDHVFALGPSERTRERAGRIVSTATDGVERAAAHQATFVAPMIASLATPAVVVIIVALAIDPLAALLLAVSIPVVPLAVIAFQAAFKSVSTRYRRSSRALAAQELDAIQGLSTLALLNAGRTMGRRLERATEDVRRHVMRYLAGNQIVLLVVDAVFSLGMVTGAVVLALWRMEAGAIGVGKAISLVLLSAIMLDPLDRIGQFFYIGMGGMASAREIRKLQAQVPEVVDAPGASVPDEGGHAPSRAPDIRLDDVSFSYDKTVPVLRNLDLEVNPAEHVVLTGPSGVGKTTVAALVQGNRRPDSGTVSIGGHDLRDVPVAWVRAQMGVVAQDTYLFTGTLRDNLLIADPRADDDRLIDALRRAHLGELMDRLPAGLDTAVGERGMALSGGEAQRVAIARALLKDAPILLLDEPTAHVDLTSEREILQALRTAAKGRTTLTISHRQATIEDAQKRLELRDGHTVALVEGTGA